MKRKQFKRNIQSSRQRRGVTYMIDKNERAFKRREFFQHAVGGFCIGLFIVVIIFAGYGVFNHA